VLYAAMPAGSFLGGVFSGWVSRVELQGRAVAAAIVVWGSAIIGFGAAVGLADGSALPWLWVAAVFFALGGAADSTSAAFRSTILQSAATDAMRGRLQASSSSSWPAVRGWPTSSTGSWRLRSAR